MHIVTVFEGAKNVHLMKGVGQIPYQLHKRHGYRATFVCFRNGPYPCAGNELRGLNMTFLPSPLGLKLKLPTVLWYLLRHAREIDVLHLIHLRKRPIVYGLVYKALNPRGFLYYKADTNSPEMTFRAGGAFFLVKLLITFLGNRALRKADVVSVETRAVLEDLKKVPRSKRILVPNAFDEDWVRFYGIRLRSFGEKEDHLICVGRHGAPAKNSQLLVDALRMIAIPGWKVTFVGRATPQFITHLESLLSARHDLRGRVSACGEITDKKELFSYYNRAKINCLPSRSEGFPSVLVEGLYFGNVVVATDHLPASWDLTEGGTVGKLFRTEDREQLASVLQELTGNPRELERLSAATMKLGRERYLWPPYIRDLNDRISSSALA
jgi:glycosyltransferase involved in cell wall biosynthesis